MKEQPSLDAGIQITEHVWIPMPDGTRLSARIWMPSHIPTGGAPAIFEYIPYRKADMVRARDERNHPFLAEHGYVSLRVDMRGSGDSEGHMPDMYAPDELADARHVIEWISTQEWCNGNVGMFGTSWGGTASLQASIDAPDALKAIIAVCATHDRYEDDIHHMGGCLITDTFEWGATLPSILALPPTAASGDDWHDRWMSRLETLTFPVENWVREEARGEFWRHASIKEHADQISCPVLSVGGWTDRYSNSVMSLVDACPDRVWGIVGPWGHHYPDKGHPGPAIGFQHVALDWWDQWLRPEARSEDWSEWPKLRVWLREIDPPEDALDLRNGAWVETGPTTQDSTKHDLWLGAGGALSDAPPTDQQSWRVPHDLLHGQAAGDTGYFGRFGGLPLDQNTDDARACVFDTPILDKDIRLYGAVEVDLDVDASHDRSQLCLRLGDVAPDGTVNRIALALVNLALDSQLDAPDAARATGARGVRVRFPTTAYRVRAGHQLRLSIGSSYWPIAWTPPTAARVAITKGVLHLPVLQDEPRQLQKAFPPPIDLPKEKSFTTLETPALERALVTHADGTVCSKWHQPLSCVRYNDVATKFAFETWATHKIHPEDPTSARSEFTHHMSVDRPDGCASVKSCLEAWCDPHQYFLEGYIEVTWGEETIFHRTWSRAIDRHLS